MSSFKILYFQFACIVETPVWENVDSSPILMNNRIVLIEEQNIASKNLDVFLENISINATL